VGRLGRSIVKNQSSPSPRNILTKINSFVEETDIRILVFAPPIIGFTGLLLGIIFMNLITDGDPYQPVTYIFLGILSFFLCFSGYSEVYKKEMPGPLGGIYKGNLAVLSGVFTIILFGSLGAVALAYGVGTLLG
jgi:hypothetical protein